ncbi:HigA family addiction module antitoxin [uncultured Parasutterella sp.]|jgi:addiction module HigA family antidote|uniref:HigA family addiction module antitoxin n=1 Tax=uncultured Parasutterella sp. TaxID=1263098 RepID=UPI0025F923BD|nr:HigA family addiction module antitoxin [uncultured Parasutterella sp.]
MTMFNPPHAGMLIADVIETQGITAAELSRALEVSASTVARILNGKINISADMALRIEKVLKIDAQLLLDIQTAYILWQAKKSGKTPLLKSLVPDNNLENVPNLAHA